MRACLSCRALRSERREGGGNYIFTYSSTHVLVQRMKQSYEATGLNYHIGFDRSRRGYPTAISQRSRGIVNDIN
jgi:hypothetical protein